MNQATVRNTEITSRETVTAGAAAYRNKTRVLTGDIENWTELKTISDNDNETQTVVDTEPPSEQDSLTIETCPRGS